MTEDVFYFFLVKVWRFQNKSVTLPTNSNIASTTLKTVSRWQDIDPRVDWAFKRIFGSEDTKECLITFLNGLFEGELVIKDVTFAKTEKLGLRSEDRGVIFDVYCITDEGKHIIVEMQKKEQEFFADRAL